MEDEEEIDEEELERLENVEAWLAWLGWITQSRLAYTQSAGLVRLAYTQ